MLTEQTCKHITTLKHTEEGHSAAFKPQTWEPAAMHESVSLVKQLTDFLPTSCAAEVAQHPVCHELGSVTMVVFILSVSA